MRRFAQKFQQFMYGRYGSDQLGTGMFVLYLVIWVISMFFRGTIVGLVFMAVEYILVGLYLFRFFSKNIYKRQRENQLFMRVMQRVKNVIRFWKMRFTERSGVNRIYRCPKCHQLIRVPKGRGKIAISCPKCRFEFVKRT